MTPEEIYRETRGRLIALASELDDTSMKTPAPALPGWTVRDTYGHLAGVCADMLDGEVEGVATPVWTQSQVGSRARYLLSEVCEEWNRRGADLDALLSDPANHKFPLTLTPVDAWHHEQDIRAALGRPVDRDGEACRWIADSTIGSLSRRWPADVPSVRLVADDGVAWTMGDAEPAASVRGSHYELARVVIGRRSRDQILAMDWTGDPEPCLDHMHAFDLPKQDLLE
ncbi:MAG: maleylpyruvate isomerase family mycothiol-dependent enzyme [Stackebrandtia sp.]